MSHPTKRPIIRPEFLLISVSVPLSRTHQDNQPTLHATVRVNPLESLWSAREHHLEVQLQTQKLTHDNALFFALLAFVNEFVFKQLN